MTSVSLSGELIRKQLKSDLQHELNGSDVSEQFERTMF